MMMPSLPLFLLFFVIPLTQLCANPKVAILSNAPELEDLLTASLDSRVDVFSRSGLSQAPAESLATGTPLSIEGADVALILDQSSENAISVRIVVAASGALIADFRPPRMPLPELADWIALRAVPYLTASADPKAPRISLIGLRFEFDSASNRSDERVANLAFSRALQNGGAVVLERWRLNDLVFEKSLLNDESPFWKEAKVIDGSLTKIPTGKFATRLRVREKGEEKSFAFEADTLEKLTAKIASGVLQLPPQPEIASEAIDPEPAAYEAEAKWMLANGLPKEAWQAAEASIALGSRTRETEVLRIQAAAMTAYPDDLSASHGQDGGYKAKAFPIEELPERVAAATETLLLAGDYWLKYHTQSPERNMGLKTPSTLVVHTLYSGLRVLRTAHDTGWYREQAAAVLALREAVRRNIEMLRNTELRIGKYTFYSYLTNYAGYWNDTPAEALEFYRQVLKPGFDGGTSDWPTAIRRELGYSDHPHPPFLVGDAQKASFPFGLGSWRLIDWSGESSNTSDLWRAFLDQLAESPDPLSQADALALRWQSTADKGARLALTVKIVDFMSANLDEFLTKNGRPMLGEFSEPLRYCTQSEELAPTQEKLVRFFLELLRSPMPIPKDTLSKVWVAFENGGVERKQAQGSELLAALAEREKQFPGMHDPADLQSARSSVERAFPELRVKVPTEGFVDVTSLWIAWEHVPQGHQNVRFHDEAALWHEGALWALDPSGGLLWKINPLTGASSLVSTATRPKTSFGSQLTIWNKRFVTTNDQEVWILDAEKTSWTKLDLPPARYRLGVSEGKLWAAAGSIQRSVVPTSTKGTTLFSIKPDLTTELVASSRRRPISNPMDATISGRPFGLFAAPRGVLLVAYEKGWRFLSSTDAKLPDGLNQPFTGNLLLSSAPDILVHCQQPAKGRNDLVRAQCLSDAGSELLLLHPKLGMGQREKEAAKARFAYPPELEKISAREYSVAWDGKTLSILAWSSEGSPWGATESWIFRINDQGCKWRPHRFVWPADGDDRVKKAFGDPKVFRYPVPDQKALIPTDQGLVITGRGMQGFWYVPYAALD